MSNRFNPLSAAVAAATAGLLVVAGGCAMSTRTDEQPAGLSRESTQNSQAPVDSAGTGDSSTMPSPSTSSTPMSDPAQTAAPADTSAYPSAPISQSSQTDVALPASSTAQTAPPSAPTPPSTDYSRSSDTAPAISGTGSGTSSSASSSTSSSSTATSNSDNASQPLPPRSDRN